MKYKQIDNKLYKGKTVTEVKYPYESWDFFSYRMYGSSDLYMTILRFNNIIDPWDSKYSTEQTSLLVPVVPSEANTFLNRF